MHAWGTATALGCVSAGAQQNWRGRRCRPAIFVLLGVLTAGGISASPVAAATPDFSHQHWDLATDFARAPQQSNPSPDRYGNPAVWSYLRGGVLTKNGNLRHDPTSYSLLPDFSRDQLGVRGLEAWWGRFFSQPDDYLPQVGVNATGHSVRVQNVLWPTGTAYAHPTPSAMAIAAWRSPVDARVAITGRVALGQHPNCGNGVLYSLDRGGQRLFGGAIRQAQQAEFQIRTRVRRGQDLYMTIDPRHGDYVCDTTILRFNIRII